MIAGTIVSLFFNANPLMRLTDIMFLVNCSIFLISYPRTPMVRAAWNLAAIRFSSFRPEWPHDKSEWVIAVYGLASWLWQFIVVMVFWYRKRIAARRRLMLAIHRSDPLVCAATDPNGT